MNFLSVYLNNVVGDPKRRAGEAKIRPHRDCLVYVEGSFDADLLSQVVKKSRIRFQPVPQHRGFTGKNGIIDLLSNHSKDSFAIVDMDYDFSSHSIKDVPNINDTSSKCCLQALFLDEKSCADFFPYLSKRLFPKQKELSMKFEKTLQENWNLLSIVAKERTYARLFRGKSGKSRKFSFPPYDRNNWPTIQEIVKKKRKCINDLVPKEYENDYAQFKQKYAQRLNQIGINDHSLEEVLGPFILYFHDFKKHVIRKEIEKAILQYTASVVDKQIVESLICHVS